MEHNGNERGVQGKLRLLRLIGQSQLVMVSWEAGGFRSLNPKPVTLRIVGASFAISSLPGQYCGNTATQCKDDWSYSCRLDS